MFKILYVLNEHDFCALLLIFSKIEIKLSTRYTVESYRAKKYVK